MWAMKSRLIGSIGLVLLALSLGVACGRGFFERDPLSDSEVFELIFEESKTPEKESGRIFSYAAVGGYIFVSKIEPQDVERFISDLQGYESSVDFRPSESEAERDMLVEFFNVRIEQIFAGREVPEWITHSNCPNGAIQSKRKKIGEFTIDLYVGVRGCNELYFIGMGERKPELLTP